MLWSSTSLIHHDLLAYGEDASASWIVECSEDELVRVCSVAEWLLYFGPQTASGSSMILAKACALAAVYVHEGTPRALVRSRRSTKSAQTADDSPGRRPNYVVQEEAPLGYGVGIDARDFWGQPDSPICEA